MRRHQDSSECEADALLVPVLPQLLQRAHRIREGWKSSDGNGQFAGPVEVDDTYFGDKRRNVSNA